MATLPSAALNPATAASKPTPAHPHAPLPGRLSIDSTYTLHTLSVLSSSKIHNRVRRVLQLLDLESDDPKQPASASTPRFTGTKTHLEYNRPTQDTQATQHTQYNPPHSRPSPPTQPGAQKPVLVRLSARAAAIAKLVSIVEIVKREAAARFARDAADMFEKQKVSGERKVVTKKRVEAMRVFQYNTLTSVEEVARKEIGVDLQKKGKQEEGKATGGGAGDGEGEDGLKMPKGRRRGKRKRTGSSLEIGGETGEVAAGEGGEGTKRVCATKATVEEYRREMLGEQLEMDYGDDGQGTGGSGVEAAREDEEKGMDDEEPWDKQREEDEEQEEDEDEYFGTLAPAGDRAGTRAAAKLAEILELDGGGRRGARAKKKKHPVPVMTVFLCRQSVWELREAYGEQSV